ncbi:MAG: AbrB/MazE/SpoVT family DNA-binding domain-containing protein, partial [Candidatus Hodarchaeota archaeon]
DSKWTNDHPTELRTKFGIREGTILTVEETEGGILLRLPKWITEMAGSGDFDVEQPKKQLIFNVRNGAEDVTHPNPNME